MKIRLTENNILELLMQLQDKVSNMASNENERQQLVGAIEMLARTLSVETSPTTDVKEYEVDAEITHNVEPENVPEQDVEKDGFEKTADEIDGELKKMEEEVAGMTADGAMSDATYVQQSVDNAKTNIASPEYPYSVYGVWAHDPKQKKTVVRRFPKAEHLKGYINGEKWIEQLKEEK